MAQLTVSARERNKSSGVSGSLDKEGNFGSTGFLECAGEGATAECIPLGMLHTISFCARLTAMALCVPCLGYNTNHRRDRRMVRQIAFANGRAKEYSSSQIL